MRRVTSASASVVDSVRNDWLKRGSRTETEAAKKGRRSAHSSKHRYGSATDSVFTAEFVYPTTAIDDFLLAGIKRMAF